MNAGSNHKHLFNHCFSSTQFYVEQAFGWWKSHDVQCVLIHSTLILHNVCVVERENELLNWGALLGQTVIN
jgi:hypothetical protein